MQIDWKHLASTPGYRSLKAAYMADVQRKSRTKEELLKLFNRVISVAKNHSHHTGYPVEHILNRWEAARDYWWLNFYNKTNVQKLRAKDSLKPMGLKGVRAYYKKSYSRDPIQRKHFMCNRIQEEQQKQSTKLKPRWSKEKRERAAFWA